MRRNRPAPAWWITIAGISGLVLLTLAHVALVRLAYFDHQLGRPYDLFDAFNLVMAPGTAALAIPLAVLHRRGRISTVAFLLVSLGLVVAGVISTAAVAVATTSLGS